MKLKTRWMDLMLLLMQRTNNSYGLTRDESKYGLFKSNLEIEDHAIPNLPGMTSCHTYVSSIFIQYVSWFNLGTPNQFYNRPEIREQFVFETLLCLSLHYLSNEANVS